MIDFNPFVKLTLEFAEACGIDIMAIRTQIGEMIGLRTNHKETIVGAINEVDLKVDVLGGLRLEADQANSRLLLKDGNNTTLSTLDVAFLNNEGTTFNLNETTGRIELLNDQGQVLSSADLQSFIKNMVVNASFHNVEKDKLEFFTADGTVAFKVHYKIENILGLQAALDALTSKTGNLPSLTTTHKTDLVGAINEVNGKTFNLPYASNKWTFKFLTNFHTDQQFRIYLNRGFSGVIAIEVTGSYANQNVNGIIRIEGGLGYNQGSSPWHNNFICTDAHGATLYSVYVHPTAFFDASNGLCYFRIDKTGGGNQLIINMTVTDAFTSTPMQPYLTENGASIIVDRNKVTFRESIYSDVDGNSKEWKEAFDRGDYRDYGLGTDPTLDLNIDTDTTVTRFMGVVPWTSGTLPFTWGNIINMSYGNGVEYSQIALDQTEERLMFRSRNSNGLRPWRSTWHEGNFNPATKADVTEINNIYDQLSGKANTRLSNVVSDLSASEKTTIKNKLGVATKTSELENDSNFVTTAVTGFRSGTNPYQQGLINLQAGTNITISQNSTTKVWTFSATDTNTDTVTKIGANGVTGTSGNIDFTGTGGTEVVKVGNTLYISQSSLRTTFHNVTATSTLPNTETDKEVQCTNSSPIMLTLPNGHRNGQVISVHVTTVSGTGGVNFSGQLYYSGSNVSTSGSARGTFIFTWNSAAARWWMRGTV